MSMSAPTTPDTPVKTPVSPKVIAATVAGFVVPGLIAVLTYVAANQDVLGIHNAVLGTFVSAVIPGLLVFLGGYLRRDPVRELGAAASSGFDYSQGE